MRQLAAFQYIQRWLLGQTRKINLIAVAGGTCSGKTFFCEALRLHAGEAFVSIIHLDDYFKDMDDPTLPHDRLGRPVFDTPESFQDQEFIRDISHLLLGYSVTSPVYDLSINRRLQSPGRVIDPRPIILADGLFTIDYLWPLHPLKVYIDTPDTVRCQRRVRRDTEAYGIPDRLVYEAFYERFLPLHQRYIASQIDNANLIVEGDGG